MGFISIDIMNSNWKEHLGKASADKLDDPSWLKDILDKYGLYSEKTMEESFITSLKELRGIMRDITLSIIDGNSINKASIERLNNYLDKSIHKYHIEQEADGIILAELLLEKNCDGILGQIALSFAELITEQDTRRLKICKNPDCRWIFFDESKNRNKCWCESKTCGNLMKVRSFRERKKLEG